MGETETAPALIVDEIFREDDAAGTRWIELFDTYIHDDPTAFLTAFNQLGDAVTTAEASTLLVDLEALETQKLQPTLLIMTYFAKRFDRECAFDKTTEDIVKTDGLHAELLEDLSSKKSYTVRTGMMHSALRTNLEATPTRDKVRRSRFGLYLKRVLDHEATTNDEVVTLDTSQQHPHTRSA